MTTFAVDTSVAVPLVVARHAQHAAVSAWWAGRDVALAGHALAECYSVLTRLPGDLRLAPADAVTLLSARFASPLVLSAERHAQLPALLAAADVSGGAVYDAMVAMAAVEHGAVLATRDVRALGTYQRIGVAVEVVGS